MSKYEYDENVELLIYHPTPQSPSLLNFVKLLKFFKLLNIESFTIIFFFLGKKIGLSASQNLCRAVQTFQPAFSTRCTPSTGHA